jgi:hypothetical protein
MILYLKVSIHYTRKLSDLINSLSKIEGCKINMQKSVAFLYTNSKLTEKEVRKIIPFTITSKKKYLGHKLNQRC